MNRDQPLLVIDLPIPPSDLARLQEMLVKEDPFCSSFTDQPMYSVEVYHQQKHFYGSETRILLDRNIYSRLVRLAKGTPASSDYRVPAAVMAFAQCSDILFEPSMAVSEGWSMPLGEEASKDLAYFRALDNLHPQNLVDIALGRTRTLQEPLLLQPIANELDSIHKRLRQFSIVYPAVLKIGLIELEGGKQIERMRKFLDWMHAEWYYTAPVTVFASLCFSGGAPGGVMKNLRHPNRQLALQGLRNASWDLAYITVWGQLLHKQEQESCLWILCSLDKALRRVASRLLAGHEDLDESLKKSLVELMGKAAGNSVFEHYARLRVRCDDPSRAINRTDREERKAHHRDTELLLEKAIMCS